MAQLVALQAATSVVLKAFSPRSHEGNWLGFYDHGVVG